MYTQVCMCINKYRYIGTFGLPMAIINSIQMKAM